MGNVDIDFFGGESVGEGATKEEVGEFGLAVAGHGGEGCWVVEGVECDSTAGGHFVDHGGEDDDARRLGFFDPVEEAQGEDKVAIWNSVFVCVIQGRTCVR